MAKSAASVESVCLYCGSSNLADPAYRAAAADFGQTLARENLRLVYGGGGVGLMGAAAQAAHEAGGRVLGIMPDFLRQREILFDDVETVVVSNMHERKMLMFQESDAFVVLPGGIGTLEEIVELLSWRRLNLHHKPVVFANLNGFWDPFFALIDHTVAEHFTPSDFTRAWVSVNRIDQIVPAIRALAKADTLELSLQPRA